MTIQWSGNRIIGCESKNHLICNPHTGELWQCPNCGRMFCDEEGAAFERDGEPDSFCDNCWAKANGYA